MAHYRLPRHDYRRGFHFISISTFPRRNILSRIENGRVVLSEIGAIVKRSMDETLRKYPDLHLRAYQIMPNHLHYVFEHLISLPRHLGLIIAYFKSRVSMHLRRELNLDNPHIFEENYHDLVSLNARQLQEFIRYVNMNPIRWQWKADHPDYFQKYYNFKHKRLPAEISWTAIGDKSLLDWPILMPVIISRKPQNRIPYESSPEYFLKCGNEGAILVSGFVSPGEKAVLEALRFAPNIRVIVFLPYGMSDYYAHGKKVDRLMTGKTLVISGFSSAVSSQNITRQNCLQNNTWIRRVCAPPETE